MYLSSVFFNICVHTCSCFPAFHTDQGRSICPKFFASKLYFHHKENYQVHFSHIFTHPLSVSAAHAPFAIMQKSVTDLSWHAFILLLIYLFFGTEMDTKSHRLNLISSFPSRALPGELT